MTRFLGLDLGGTNIKSVVLDDDSDPTRSLVFETAPTHAERGPLGVIERLVEVGGDLIERLGPIDAVGLGVPGLFDAASGAIDLFPNLPGPWRGQPIRDPVAAGLGRDVILINDARAFSLAEARLGAGRGCSIVVCLTLGTGVGGGIVIDGRLHLGAWGVAGEIGHQTVDVNGPRCGCGNRGCVEALTKAEALTELAGKHSAEEVYRTARQGDPDSVAAIETVASWLGVGLANVVTVLGPDRIVVGGGISTAGELVLGPIRAAVRKRVTLVPSRQIEVVAAELGPAAGAVGAALAASRPDDFADQAERAR